MLYPFVMLDNIAARSSICTCALKRLDDNEDRKGCEINRGGPTLRLYSDVLVCIFCIYNHFRAITCGILGVIV
jgi:hypothetical protein